MKIVIILDNESYVKIYTHLKGLFESDFVYAHEELIIEKNSRKTEVLDLTSMTSVNYDGERCNSDPFYLHDECRYQQIHKASTIISNDF